MTGEEWDTAYWRIYNDAREDFAHAEAKEIANDETVAQFGLHPGDVAS